jgi:hypothetical protein
VAPRKKAVEESKTPPLKIKRAFKPEKCTSHKFVMELDGRVDMLASHEVTDDSICFNCGLYFSTWTWYSDKITESFRKGVDNEAGQTINFIAKQLDSVTDKPTLGFGRKLLDKLRERRTTNGKRI